jgi:pimeloyl-ACP methyl ester carboxylesterase
MRRALLLVLAASGCGESPARVPDAGALFIESGDVMLAATLDLPPGSGPFPAMVFVPGSGRTTRSADRAAVEIALPRGVAVLTYDKRGLGGSTGRYQDVDVENSVELLPERADDVAAIVELLATRADIDPERIFLWGASQGGWVAPLAARRSQHVAFVICASGGGSSVGIEDHYHRLADDESLDVEALTAMLADYTGPAGYDPEATLGELEVPALFIYGGMDRSNPTYHDIANLERIRAESGRDFTILLFPDADHELVDAATGTFDPELFPMTFAWAQLRL